MSIQLLEYSFPTNAAAPTGPRQQDVDDGTAVWDLIKDEIERLPFNVILDTRETGKAWIRFPYFRSGSGWRHIPFSRPVSCKEFDNLILIMMCAVDFYQFLSARPLKRSMNVVQERDSTVFRMRYTCTCERCPFQVVLIARRSTKNAFGRCIQVSLLGFAVHDCQPLTVEEFPATHASQANPAEVSMSRDIVDVDSVSVQTALRSHDALLTFTLSSAIEMTLYSRTREGISNIRRLKDVQEKKRALSTLVKEYLGLVVNPERAYQGLIFYEEKEQNAMKSCLLQAVIWSPLMLIAAVVGFVCSWVIGIILMADVHYRIHKEQDLAREAKEFYSGAVKVDAFVCCIHCDGKVPLTKPSNVVFDCMAWRNQLYQIDYAYQDPTFHTGDEENQSLGYEEISHQEWIKKRIYTSTLPHTDTFPILVLPNDPQTSYPEYLLNPEIYPEFGHLSCSCCGCRCTGRTQQADRRVAQSTWNLGVQWILFFEAQWVLIIAALVPMGKEITAVLIACLVFIYVDFGLFCLTGWIFSTNVKRKFFKLSSFECFVEEWLLWVRAQADDLAGLLKFWIRCFFLGLVIATIIPTD